MQAGDRFERRIRWTREQIKAFAREVGDSNPLHHDDAYAERTRFGQLIASGTQTVAYMMAVCGSQSTAQEPGVGLEFTFRLVGPALADEEMTVRWEVTSVEDSERPRGRIVSLHGEMTGEGERRIATADARTLFVDVL
jgi:acyl dehydratase